MKIRATLTLFSLVMTILSATSQTVQTVINVPVGSSRNFEALLFKPKDYNTAVTAKYPLLIFLHGSGESRAPLTNIYNNSTAGGPSYFIEHGGWPVSFINPVNRKAYKFLVLSPQAVGSGWSTSGGQLNLIIQYMVKNYRVDSNRIYLTGLSAGGDGILRYAGHLADDNGVVTNPRFKAAALVPMSEANGSPSASLIASLVKDSIKVWGFGSAQDAHGVNTQELVININRKKNGMGRFSSYDGGHCCWNRFYNPNYRETVNGVKMNIYEWMLQFSRENNVDLLDKAK